MRTISFAIGAFYLFSAASANPIVQRVYHEKRNLAQEGDSTLDARQVWVDRNGNTVIIETIPTATAKKPDGSASNVLEPETTGTELPWMREPGYADATREVEEDPPLETGYPDGWNTLGERDEASDTLPGSSLEEDVELDLNEKDAKRSLPSGQPLEKRAELVSLSGNGLGIGYSPYNGQGSCKSQDQVSADIANLGGYNVIRFYGVDCNQATTVLNAAKANNKQVFAGIYDLSKLDNELDTLISAARSSWNTVAGVSIGNECINGGRNSAADVVNAVNRARGKLRSAGYGGPVVTVDTVNSFLKSPEICHASDFCAVNCHPFFDPNTSAPNSGSFVKGQIDLVSKAVGGGKRIVITETGWPHQGQGNGQAVPSKQNQQIAIQSLRDAFRGREGDLFLFSAFDDGWKKDTAYTFGTEHYWGIL